MGDAVSHAVLPGIATSFLLGIGIFPGALAAGLLTTVGIGYVHQTADLRTTPHRESASPPWSPWGWALAPLPPAAPTPTRTRSGTAWRAAPPTSGRPFPTAP